MRRVMIGILVAVCFTACERRHENGAAPAPANAAPASTRAATEPAVAVEGASVTIDGVAHAFPPTGVKLRTSGERMTAVVYSLAAAGGAADDETHAAMNLRFSFPNEDWEAAGSGVGHIVTANAGREESPFGLFLDDGETQLVPADVTIEVRRAEGADARVARVTVKGRFVRKDLIAPDLPFTTVSGAFDAAIEEAP